MLLKLKLVGLMCCLLIAAIWVGMPAGPVSACDEWTGGGLDDGPLQSLLGGGGPLQGRDYPNPLNRSAMRALLDDYLAAGQPANFDPSPYFTYGPDCDGGINQIKGLAPNGGRVGVAAANTAANAANLANNNDNGNDND